MDSNEFDSVEYEENDFQMESARKMKPSTSMHVSHDIEFFGNMNLKRNLESLENETWNATNIEEKIRSIESVVLGIDDSVRNNSSRSSEMKKALDADIRDSGADDVDWRQNIWYGFFLRQAEMANPIVDNSSWKSWQIMYLQVALNKAVNIIKNVVSEERDMKVYNLLKDINEKESKRTEERIKEIRETYKEMMSDQNQQHRMYVAQILGKEFDKGNNSDVASQKSVVEKKPVDVNDELSQAILNHVKKKYEENNDGCIVGSVGPSFRKNPDFDEKEVNKRVTELIRVGALFEEDLGHPFSKNKVWLPEYAPKK